MESVRTRCWSVSVRKSRWCRRSSALAVAVTWATSACRTVSASTARSCSTPTSILHGGPAPVRRYLPDLIKLVWNKKINPGKVFDLTLPLDQVAEGYRAMDERRAIKTLLRPTR